MFPICFPIRGSVAMRLTKGNLSKITLPAGKAEILIFDDDLKGFGLRIRAGGKRTWLAQYRLGDKQRRLTLGTIETLDPDEARKRARAALAQVSLGDDPAVAKVEKVKAQAVTIRSTLPGFFAYAEPRQRPSHFDGTKRYMEQHWGPLLDLPLKAIDRARVAARLVEIAKASGPYAGNRARAALSSYFSWAIGAGIADANPTIGTHKSVEEVARDRVLSAAELRLIWRNAGEGDFGRILRLLMLTGARRDEIAGMSWDELSGSTLTIPGTRTKNRRPLVLDLPPAALAVLAEVPRRAGRPLLFGSGAGGFSGFGKALAGLAARIGADLREAGAPKADLAPWRIHDIRRSVATHLGDLGVQPHVIEALLNHVSGSKGGVAGVYNRSAYRDEVKAALSMWAENLANIVEPNREPSRSAA